MSRSTASLLLLASSQTSQSPWWSSKPRKQHRMAGLSSATSIRTTKISPIPAAD